MWSPLVGYEGLYEISDDGMVRITWSGYVLPVVNGKVSLSRNCRFKMLSVARLVEQTYGRLDRKRRKYYKPALDDRIREVILKRDNCKCVECGCTESLHVHHKIHKKNGGTDELSNLITLCSRCHALKHQDEPIYSAMRKVATLQL